MRFAKMSAADIGREIEVGRTDPVEVCEAFLQAIDGHTASVDIYARVSPARALKEAGMAQERAKSGKRKGLLDGVPVSWKDLYDTKGIGTESGAALLKGRVPDKDAVVLENATAAGAVCLGKTHQTEFAFSGLGVNPNTATPPNRLLPGHCPGGSSSGAAASITHGLAPIAIGMPHPSPARPRRSTASSASSTAPRTRRSSARTRSWVLRWPRPARWPSTSACRCGATSAACPRDACRCR